MSARPTSADVLRIIGNDATLDDAARAAAVLARASWMPHPGTSPAPAGWIGGNVRSALPEWLDDALGTWDDDDVDGDPTGEIGSAFYPREIGHVTGRESLDALPVGALMVDRDGYVFVKESGIVTEPDGTRRHFTEYRTIFNPDDERVTAGESPGAAFGADEIAGDYAEPGSGSSFLPGRAYMVKGAR